MTLFLLRITIAILSGVILVRSIHRDKPTLILSGIILAITTLILLLFQQHPLPN